MSDSEKLANTLLAELRRFAGETPLTARIAPMQWVAIAKEIGLSEKARGEAIAHLRSKGLIAFKPETTEIIALSNAGIESGDRLIRQAPKVTDPMPNSLEEIVKELDYWELHLNAGEVGSNDWVKAKERIGGLRHRENRFRAATSVTYNAIGPNSRINQNSVDRSTNQVDRGINSEDWERLAEKFSASCRFLRADSQWTSTTRADVWTIAGGDRGMCKALLERAGAMLLKSPKVCAQLSQEVVSETDNLSRWLLFLKEKGCFETSFFASEELEDGTKITHVMSSTRDLPGDSARICIQCAAAET